MEGWRKEVEWKDEEEVEWKDEEEVEWKDEEEVERKDELKSTLSWGKCIFWVPQVYFKLLNGFN